MVYCTLFDSNYLDRGLVCIQSLCAVDVEAKIYVLCMDDSCYEVLLAEQIIGIIPIKLADFEDLELLSVKSNRSRGEYCWSCTAKLIKYILINYLEEMCTYIDADLMFFSDPSVIIDEMKTNNCSVQVVPHNFAPDYMHEERIKSSGKYCVQFNTFTKEKKSMNLLDDWIRRCIDDCSLENGGDQKYTEEWENLDFVNKSRNLGAGIAPWNVNRFKLIDNKTLEVVDKFTKVKASVIFYHYQDLVFPENGKARVVPYLSYWFIDKELIKKVYNIYLYELFKTNQYVLEKYGIRCKIYRYITETKKERKSLLKRISNWLRKSPSIKVNYISTLLLFKLRKKEAMFNFPPC